jgi:hypothetical protein
LPKARPDSAKTATKDRFLARLKMSSRTVPSKKCGRCEATRAKSLKAAAFRGWQDIDAGRSIDVTDAELEGFIRQLGQTAAGQVQLAAQSSADET